MGRRGGRGGGFLPRALQPARERPDDKHSQRAHDNRHIFMQQRLVCHSFAPVAGQQSIEQTAELGPGHPQRGQQPRRQTLQVGEHVRVKVKTIDASHRRLALTRKGLPEAVRTESGQVA